ncbi:MAG: ATP-binding cassette domain-containing protein, partial [Bacteroidota bacterium]
FVRSLSVAENLKLAQHLAGIRPDMKVIQAILDRLNIGHKTHASTSSLSVGEQQRVNIARAVVNQPSVILADEPTSALDDLNTEQVIALLKEQAASVDATLVIVTHDNRLTTIFDKQIQL